ncbi:MAG: hypothetical protein AAFV69_00325 [Pseudomonadota bacterium]
MRIFYFDIDGTVRDYDDQPFKTLANGELQLALKQRQFNKLVCLSGWVWFAKQGVNVEDKNQVAQRIWDEIPDIFPDKTDFIEKLGMCPDPDKRAESIDLESDWYYVDDWADKFFTEAWGQELFDKHNGSRICQVDPHGDGSDLFHFIRNIG